MANKHQNLRSTFGNTLLTYRKRAGLTAEELGNKIGVHRKTVNRWENETRLPYSENWNKLIRWAEKDIGTDGVNALIRAYAKTITEYGRNADSGVYVDGVFISGDK